MSSPVWTVLCGDGGALECDLEEESKDGAESGSSSYGICKCGANRNRENHALARPAQVQVQNESRSLKSEEAQPSTKQRE